MKKLREAIIAMLFIILSITICPAAVNAGIKEYSQSHTWITEKGNETSYKITAKVTKTKKKHWKISIISGNKTCRTIKVKGRKPAIKFIDSSDLTLDMLINRKGKNVIYIEKQIGVCTTNNLDGKTINGWYLSYRNAAGISQGDLVISYFVYNPNTNYEDDIVARFDYAIK